jgi:hypothetical protein
MTLLHRAPKASPDGDSVPAGDAGVRRLVARLRDHAARLVPFSEDKVLFLEAASTLERLDRQAETDAAAVRRLEAGLACAPDR